MNNIAAVELSTIQKANAEARKLGTIDIREYALRNPQKWPSGFLQEVLSQYQFLKKLELKLPLLAQQAELLGAENINIEQSTSEEVARFKFNGLRLKNTLDLTGGFGIDSYFLSHQSERHIYCETNENLVPVVKYNFQKLGISNTVFFQKEAEEYLKETKESFDLIYLDPDRRNAENSKLVLIEVCSPNVLDLQEIFLQTGKEVWVKYSPLLDITRAANQLQGVYEILIIAVKNDVKEILFKIKPNISTSAYRIRAVNLNTRTSQEFEFSKDQEIQANATLGEVSNFLYEPNAALMKSGAFNLISERFQLKKLATHTHYYSADFCLTDFPGKVFKVNGVWNPSQKNLKKWAGEAFHVLARNYPLKPETIRQKYRLRDGGTDFLIFTTDYKNQKIVIHCTKIPDHE